MKSFKTFITYPLATVLIAILFVCGTLHAESAAKMEAKANNALAELYKTSAGAKSLGTAARAILVFPSITKGGLIVGGQYGEGVLFQNGKATGYYSSAAASYGLQIGLQKFGYALFFMNDSDLDYLRKSSGWEIGVGPTLTIVDSGMAKSLTTTTAREGVYAFFFAQKGLMAGIGLQGAKISQIHPK